MLNDIISVKNLQKSFGGLKAVDVNDLTFMEGQLTSIIGPNGAGKTTFFDLISGFQNADSGEVFLNEKNISNSQPYKIARMGMVRTFQLTKVFDRMTVMDNLLFSGSDINNDSFLNSIIKLNSQKLYENNLKEKTFVVAGGVAANQKIRTMLLNLCKENDYKGIFPPIEICGDNAAMIAMVGLEKYKLKQFNKLDHPAKPRWPLDEKALFLKGAGVKL